jgi:hypothetical protein
VDNRAQLIPILSQTTGTKWCDHLGYGNHRICALARIAPLDTDLPVGYKQGYPLIHSPYYDDDPILIQKRWAETMGRNDGQKRWAETMGRNDGQKRWAETMGSN